jgi:hypothetical protein
MGPVARVRKAIPQLPRVFQDLSGQPDEGGHGARGVQDGFADTSFKSRVNTEFNLLCANRNNSNFVYGRWITIFNPDDIPPQGIRQENMMMTGMQHKEKP